MANTASAKKAIRVTKRKTAINLRIKNRMKEAIKEVHDVVKANKKKEAEKLLSKAYKAIDKAAKRGVIKKNTAARYKSRLTRRVNEGEK